jgi:hypothetical protein
MMKNIFAVVAVAVALAAPTEARAQSAATPVPVRAVKSMAKPGKGHQKHPTVWRPTAAQRALRPSDLVAVTTPSGEKRYMRKRAGTRTAIAK